MNKQMLIHLDPSNLDKINKLLEEGWTLGHQYNFGITNNENIVVLNKFIQVPGQPNNYNGYNLGGY